MSSIAAAEHAPSRSHAANVASDPVVIGAEIGAGLGLTALGHSTYARARKGAAMNRLTARLAEQQGAANALQGARDALDDNRASRPADASAGAATKWVRSMFGGEVGMRAYTQEGTARNVALGRMGSPSPQYGAALDEALSMLDGRAGGVVKAGELYVPVRFTDSLFPIEKTRQVSYQETVWEYHHGPNPPPAGKYEYHYGPHQVTRHRTEHYLDNFNRFSGQHDGLQNVVDAQGNQLSKRATLPEKAVKSADEALQAADDAVRSAARSVRYARKGAKYVQVAGAALILAGAGAAAWQITNRDK